MGKFILLACFFSYTTVSLAESAGVVCSNVDPSGRKSQLVTLQIFQAQNQTYTAHLNIVSWDAKPVASETITDLSCYFSTNKFPVVRCHHRSTDSYALSVESISTTSMELLYLPNQPQRGTEVTIRTISASMDVTRDNVTIPYGYGEIMFHPGECSRL